jgi:hypothetical protein
MSVVRQADVDPEAVPVSGDKFTAASAGWRAAVPTACARESAGSNPERSAMTGCSDGKGGAQAGSNPARCLQFMLAKKAGY